MDVFYRCVLLPLLGMKPPQQSLYLLVDSVDEGCNVTEGEQTSTSLSGTVAELLAGHHEFFPPWLLLLCSARKQSKAVTKMFTGKRNSCHLQMFFIDELNNTCGASLGAQWLRIRLPMQGTRVRALVGEDPTCRGATRPVSHNC